ncbi:MAG: N5-glutamine methyltransferase family protein, partial [Acidimicrobiales bacterium]
MRAREAVARATLRLADAGVESPQYEAEILLADVLGVPHTRLGLAEDVTEDQVEAFDALVMRRSRREPLQHLTGVSGFRYVEVAVGPGVFVPRPETELLAGWAVDRLTGIAVETDCRPVVVDLCTGSGAIALALTTE